MQRGLVAIVWCASVTIFCLRVTSASALDPTGVTELDALLALCPDPVLLGNRLLDTAEDLASFPEADGYGELSGV